MNTIQLQTYKSPVGDILLGSFAGRLCLNDWKHRKQRSRIDKRLQKGLNSEYVEESSSVIEETIKQLQEYFTLERTSFDIPLLKKSMIKINGKTSKRSKI